ncbi:MAG: FtsX-like permease family protein [Acidobacteriota bacterium]
MFFRLLLESLRRGRRRKLIAAAAIGLGTLATTAVGTLLLASGDRLAAELAAYGANIELQPATGELFPIAGLMKTRQIFWRNNLLGVAPLFAVRVGFEVPSRSPIVAPVVGTWFDFEVEPGWRTGLPRTRPSLSPEGRWPRDDAQEIALGRRLAVALAAHVGETVRMRLAGRDAAARVVGLVGGGAEEEDQAFAPLGLLAELTGRADAIPRAEVLALTVPERDVSRKDPRGMSATAYDSWFCTAYPSSIALQLEQAVPGTRASVVRGVAGAGGELIVRLRGVLLALAAVLLAAAVLGTTAAMTATTLERRLEVGLFAALGAERRQVAFFFLAEAAVVGWIGGLTGGGLGLLAGRWLGRGVFGVEVPWTPVLLPFAVLAGIAVALLGSAPPVLRTVRLDSARVLKRAAA